MASSSEASCVSDPNFAVICAFLERFAKPCGITYPTFVDLQEMLENVEQVPKELVDLHIKLLRKARKTVFVEKWEKAVIKFCQSYSSQDGWEIERFGYLKSRLEVKLRVLKMLLEGQFDLNNKFKNEINTLEAGELRSKPIGKDKLGRIYWLQFDPSSNVRVYREDLDEDSWTLVAKDRSSLVELLQELSGDEYPLDLNSLNEDSTSLDKPSVDTGQNSNFSYKNEENCEGGNEKHQSEIINAVKNEVNDESNQESENGKTKEINGETIANGDMRVEDEQPSKKIKLSEDEEKVTSNDIKDNENVGEAITEPVMHITGEGEGEENQTGNVFANQTWTKGICQGFLEDDIVGEAIEEPVMYIIGEGDGEDCETGNPDKEENSQEKAEKETKDSTELETLPEKLKPPPKLWSIDTICGVNSKDTSVDEKQESVDIKTKQKSFSTFSIDSVLEKKETDSPTSENLSYPKFPVSSNSSFLQTDETPKVFTDSLILKTENTPTVGFNKCVSENESSEKIVESDGKTNEINNSSDFVTNIELIKPTTTVGVEEKSNSEETIQSSVERVDIKNLTPEKNNLEKSSEARNSEQTHSVESKLLTEKREPVTKSLNLENKIESNCYEKHSTDQLLTTENVATELLDCKAEVETKEIRIENAQSSPKELTSVPDFKSEAQLEIEKEEAKVQKTETENASKETLKITGNSIFSISDNFNAKPSSERVEEKFVPIESRHEIINESPSNYSKESNNEEVENLKGTISEVITKPVIDDSEKVSKDLSENKNKIENEGVDNSSDVKGECVITKNEVETSEKPIKTHELKKIESAGEKSLNKTEKQEKIELKKPEATTENLNKVEVIESEKQFFESDKSCSQVVDKSKLENSSESQGLSEENLELSQGLKKLDEKEQILPENESLGKTESKKIEESKEKKEETEVEKSISSGKDIEIFKSPPDDSINLQPVVKNPEVENIKEPLLLDPKPIDAKPEISVEVRNIVEIDGESPNENLKNFEQNKSENKVEEIASPFEESSVKEKNVKQLSEQIVLEKGKQTEKEDTKTQIFEEVEQSKEALTKSNLSSEKKDNLEQDEVDLKLENKNNETKLEMCIEFTQTVDLQKNEGKELSQEITQTSEVVQETKKVDIEKKEKKEVEEITKLETAKQEEELTKRPKIMAVEDLKNFEEKLDVAEMSESAVQEIKKPKEVVHSETLVQEKEKKSQVEKIEHIDKDLKEIEEDKKGSKLNVPVAEKIKKEENLKSEKIEASVDIKESINKELKIEEENKTNLSEFKNVEKIQIPPEEKKDEAKLTDNLEEGNLKPEVIEENKDKEEVSKNEDEKSNDEEAVTMAKKKRRRKKSTDQIASEVIETPQRILRNRKVESEIKAEIVDNVKKRRGKTKVEVNESQKEEKEVEDKKDEEKENNKQEKGESIENEESAPKEEKVVKKVGRKPRRRRGATSFSFVRRKQKKAARQEKSSNEKEGEQKEKKDKKERKRTRRGSLSLMADETSGTPQKNVELETSAVRQSRRIAQIKLKEDAERRRLEEEQLKSFKSKKDKHSKSGKRKSKKNEDSDSYDEKKNGKDDSDNEKSKGKEGKKRRKKKKDKLKFNELNPWISSSGSSSAVEEEEELEEIEPHEEDELVFKSDHEFSPESDVEDPEYKPIKRARTAKVEESKDQVGKYDETACEKCGNTDHPEWILLCDKCDKGWHASCIRPALMVVPEGDWFCPPCEHLALITKLKESLIQYDKCQKQRENEELRKKRLAFVGISLDNVLPPNKKKVKNKDEDVDEGSLSETESSSQSGSESESSSSDSSEPVYQLRQRRSNVTSYRYNEYDELIKSALQDEIEAVKGAGNEGKGKDINNIVIANRKEAEENADRENKDQEETAEPNKENTDIEIDKPKEKLKKGEDQDYEVGSEGEEEEDEDLVDELPPVVPKYDNMKKKKSKSVKITSLDFTSEEEDNNSDSDFKGESSEDESEYSMGSGSESSDNNRRRRNSDGPLRRSTRARTSRYDRDFINDDSEDESPKRKKKRRSWDSSEESDSDESWGRRKRKTNKFYNKSFTSGSKKKSKKKKQKKRMIESGSEEEVKPKKPKNKKIKYGGLDSAEEDNILSRRTRGKKINYQEMNGSDSEDETVTRKSKSARVIESDDDFVAEKEEDEQIEESEENESGANEEEYSDEEDFEEKRKSSEKGKKLLENKKENSLASSKDEKIEKDSKEDETNNLEEESEDLDPEEEEILGDILESGEVPISELKSAVKKAKEQRRLQKEAELKEKEDKDLPESVAKTLPPIPAHLEYPGIVKNPKVGKVKITPTRAELAQQMAAANVQLNPTPAAGKPANILQSVLLAKPTEGQKTVNPSGVFGQGNVKLNVANIPPNHSKDDTLAPPPNPFMPRPPEMLSSGPLNMMAMMSAHPQGAGNKSSVIAPPIGKGPFNAFQGPPPPGLPPYQTTIPATVAGLSKPDINLQGQKPEPLPGTTIKRKTDEASPSPENFGEGSQPSSVQRGEEFMQMQDSPPKKKVRGRGKKQLLAEAQALAEAQGKQEKPVVTIQAPTHFPPRGVPPEGGSVISRMLSAPQIFPGNRPPFRSSHPPQYPNSPIRMRVPLPGAPMFHTSHPHDPSPSGGGPINLPPSTPIAKPPPPGGTFAPRFPPDSAVRHPFPAQSSPPPPRSEFSSFPNYYGNFPPPNSSHPGGDDTNYQNPPSYPEQFEDGQGAGGGSSSKSYEDESGGEFGGLASYFASQREDDLDT